MRIMGILTLLMGLVWLLPYIGWKAQLGKALLVLAGLLFVLLPQPAVRPEAASQRRAQNWLAFIAGGVVAGFGMSLTATGTSISGSWLQHLVGCIFLILGAEFIAGSLIKLKK